MTRKKVGRPSKIDTETMSKVNILFIIIVIIFILLLMVGIVSITNPKIIEMLKGSIMNLFK